MIIKMYTGKLQSFVDGHHAVAYGMVTVRVEPVRLEHCMIYATDVVITFTA
jgi:hypothetical protein